MNTTVGIGAVVFNEVFGAPSRGFTSCATQDGMLAQPAAETLAKTLSDFHVSLR
jgi:hypothetical protein